MKDSAQQPDAAATFADPPGAGVAEFPGLSATVEAARRILELSAAKAAQLDEVERLTPVIEWLAGEASRTAKNLAEVRAAHESLRTAHEQTLARLRADSDRVVQDARERLLSAVDALLRAEKEGAQAFGASIRTTLREHSESAQRELSERLALATTDLRSLLRTARTEIEQAVAVTNARHAEEMHRQVKATLRAHADELEAKRDAALRALQQQLDAALNRLAFLELPWWRRLGRKPSALPASARSGVVDS